MTYDLIFAALSDPTRRRIIEGLRPGPRRLGELARGMTVSRPAVSQHVKVLCDAGLVVATGPGPRKVYALNPGTIAELRGWLDQLWDDALDAFAKAAAQEARRPCPP